MKFSSARAALSLGLIAVVLCAMSPRLVFGQDALEATLDGIYRDYSEFRRDRDVGGLVVLDWALRSLFQEPPEGILRGQFLRRPKWKAEYEDIGIEDNHWYEGYIYTGKVLLDAHRINPNSAYRESTLYSKIWNGSERAVPSPQAAEAYLREFPAGPFADHLYVKLAYFYDDLYKVIHRETTGESRDYKYDCFAPHLTQRPLQEQLRTAQSLAVKYYEVAAHVRPGNENLRRAFANMKQGKPELYSWHFCPD